MRAKFVFESTNKDWLDLTDDEKSEILFGPQTNLDKQFSKIMVSNLISDDEEISEKWSTYYAISIELEKINSIYVKELKYRITDKENPNKVCLDLINKVSLMKNREHYKKIIQKWYIEDSARTY
jgi:hypothetical protein